MSRSAIGPMSAVAASTVAWMDAVCACCPAEHADIPSVRPVTASTARAASTRPLRRDDRITATGPPSYGTLACWHLSVLVPHYGAPPGTAAGDRRHLLPAASLTGPGNRCRAAAPRPPPRPAGPRGTPPA